MHQVCTDIQYDTQERNASSYTYLPYFINHDIYLISFIKNYIDIYLQDFNCTISSTTINHNDIFRIPILTAYSNFTMALISIKEETGDGLRSFLVHVNLHLY